MRKKKLLILIGSICLAVMLALPLTACPAPTPTPTPTPEPEEVDLLYGCGSPTTSSWYPANAKMNELVDNIPGIRSSLVLIAGSEAVARDIYAGRLNWGGCWGPGVFVEALRGEGKWEGMKQENTLRALFVSAEMTAVFAVREDSGVTSLSELEGKKFFPGFPGSTSQRNCIEIFDALGIKVDPFVGSLGDAVAAIKDNRIIGYFKAAGYRTLDATHIDIMSRTPLTFFGPTDEEVDKIRAKYPIQLFRKFPPGYFEQLPELGAVNLLAGPAMAGVSRDVPEEVVYKMIKAVHEGHDQMIEVFGLAAGVDYLTTPLTIAQIPGDVYVHAGAIRYYREMGAEIPEGVIPPEMK